MIQVKETLLVIIGIIILVILLFAGYIKFRGNIVDTIAKIKVAESEAFLRSNWVEYQNEKENYSIYYLKIDLIVETNKDGFNILSIRRSADYQPEEFLPLLQSVQLISQPKDPKEIVKLRTPLTDIETGPEWRDVTSWQKINEKQIFIASNIAAKEEIWQNSNDNKLKLNTVRFKKEGKFYQIKFFYDEYEANIKNKYGEDYSILIGSFKFIE